MSPSVAWAGFVAAVLSAAFFWLARSLKITRFSPSEQLGGTVFADPRHPGAESLGFVVLLILGTTLLPLLYAVILRGVGEVAWWTGLLLGAFHGAAAAAALPLFGTISAGVRAGRAAAPGRFGISWGRWTPAVIVLGHALYGAVFGAILASS